MVDIQKTLENEMRDKRVSISFKPTELDLLRAHADRKGLTIGMFLRSIALAEIEKPLGTVVKTQAKIDPKYPFPKPLHTFTRAGLNGFIQYTIDVGLNMTPNLLKNCGVSKEAYSAILSEIKRRHESDEPLYYLDWDDELPQGPVYHYDPDSITMV